MTKINLNYINADDLMLILSDGNFNYLYDYLENLINNDYYNALGYIQKYDNKYSVLNGTDVSELKKQMDNLDKNFKKLKKILEGVV